MGTSNLFISVLPLGAWRLVTFDVNGASMGMGTRVVPSWAWELVTSDQVLFLCICLFRAPKCSLPGMIKHLFEQAECDHPVAMVSHSLGYVTAAQYGLSESELLDILACDEQVTSELQAPPTPLQWAQLYHGLAPFLQVGVGVGGAAVLRWGHRKVQEVARSRYLGDEETTHARFQLLADYFSGMTKCQGGH